MSSERSRGNNKTKGISESRIKKTPPKMNMSQAEKALREANGETGLSIKGASARGNVVQVGGLAQGTSSEDVEVNSLSKGS